MKMTLINFLGDIIKLIYGTGVINKDIVHVDINGFFKIGHR